MDREFKSCKSCGGEVILLNASHQLVQCTDCNFIFTNKKYSISEFEEVYNKLYNDGDNPIYAKHSIIEYNNLKNGIVKIGHNRKHLLKRFVKKDHKILEIGSGIGLVGYYLNNERNVADYAGVEIDSFSNKKARDLGINSREGDFEIMENLDSDYDVIMLWEVLEHIQDLSKFFKLAQKNLKQGGIILISVPNYNKRDNFKDNGDRLFQSGPPVHLNFFQKETLVNVFEKHNFQINFLREKRFPYFKKNVGFLKNVIKSCFGFYRGSTLYLVAQKK